MRYQLLWLTAFILMIFFAMPATGIAQKKRKRNTSAPGRSAHAPRIHARQAPAVDITQPGPNSVPIPQAASLRPDLKKTKKVVIVPAPPPPPGRDPVPPYPKR